MAMTQFEKTLISELQGIKKELHELNKNKPTKGQIDGATMGVSIDVEGLSNEMGRILNRNQRGLS